MSFIGTAILLALLSAVVNITSGQISYNSKKQICCNGIVSDRRGSLTMTCFGALAYDYSKFVDCRNEQLLEIPSDGNHYSCCDNQKMHTSVLYNHDSHQCCNGKAIFKPDPNIYYHCCDGQLFDYNSQICCGGQILSRSDPEGCCGGLQIYNISSQLCCQKYGYNDDYAYMELGFKLHERNSNLSTIACCELEVYDYSKDVCCDGILKPKKLDIPKFVVASCCNGEPYDFFKQICCTKWGHVGDSKNLAALEQILHEVDLSDPASSCCGGALFDRDKQVCCNDNAIVPKPEGSHTFDPIGCCGDQAMNYNTHSCFGNTVYEIGDRNLQLCGDTVYDMRAQLCCNDRVFVNDPNLTCCYEVSQMFDPSSHKCCLDVVVPQTFEDTDAGIDDCCVVGSNGNIGSITLSAS